MFGATWIYVTLMCVFRDQVGSWKVLETLWQVREGLGVILEVIETLPDSTRVWRLIFMSHVYVIRSLAARYIVHSVGLDRVLPVHRSLCICT